MTWVGDAPAASGKRRRATFSPSSGSGGPARHTSSVVNGSALRRIQAVFDRRSANGPRRVCGYKTHHAGGAGTRPVGHRGRPMRMAGFLSGLFDLRSRGDCVRTGGPVVRVTRPADGAPPVAPAPANRP